MSLIGMQCVIPDHEELSMLMFSFMAVMSSCIFSLSAYKILALLRKGKLKCKLS